MHLLDQTGHHSRDPFLGEHCLCFLDNATLTAAEISTKMSQVQIQAVLMGLLISGGMLIPGNIPNIISAGKLGISSKEWAKLGVPLGLVLMLIYFIWVFYIPFHIEFHF